MECLVNLFVLIGLTLLAYFIFTLAVKSRHLDIDISGFGIHPAFLSQKSFTAYCDNDSLSCQYEMRAVLVVHSVFFEVK